MAAGPGVSMQSGSPAREITLSVQQGGNQNHADRIKTEEVSESEKQSRMAALLERLHAKHNASRPWQETSKVVRQAMEKRGMMNAAGHQLLLTCLETLQRALKVSSLPSMTDRLESIARQNMLGSHLSPSGTECYITSDMFYVEVQLDTGGQLVDVKVAHQGENPTSCPELIQHLREKNFEEFSKHLKGLVELYKLPGDNKLKTKMYIALQSLELDLTKMMHMFRLATNANTVDTILRGSVGLLTARSGGHLVSLQCYVSPYDIFEEGTGTQLNLTDSNVPRSLGVSVSVTIEGTSAVYKLPIAPLITGSHPVDNKGTPSFSTVTNSNCVDLPACFFLKMNRPMPFSLSFIQRMGNATSIPVFESPPSLSPLYQLIVQSQLQLLEEGSSTPPPSHNMHFYSILPDQQHCYFLNGDAPVQDGHSLQGALVSKIPFRHPAQVSLLLDIIRHQAAYNNLIGSCVKQTSIKEDNAGLLQFEVCPLTDSSFSVSFQHPVNESLVCVVMEVIDSLQVSCKLYKGLSDALICTDEFITKVVQRCMSIPVTMRAIRRKAETIQADTPALSLIAQTVETMVKNNLPPSGSPTYNMAGGDAMGLPGLTGGNTPTGGGPAGGPNFTGPITLLYGMSRPDRQGQGGECAAQGGAAGQQQMQQQQQAGLGHSDDYNKVTQNPILTSLLQITGSVGSSPSSQNAPPPHQTPPPTSSPASNTKNHPMLMNLLKDNPTQDFAALYGSSPLERQNSSSGSPRTDGMGGSCPGGSAKIKKKRPRGTEKGGVLPGAAAGAGGSGLGMKTQQSSMQQHHQHHQVTHEDDFHRELLSMDVDASQNSIFDVNLTGDGLDTPHSITPAPSQCGTPPSGPSMPYSQSHVQSQQQPPGTVPPRMVRLSSSDSIGPDITEILSDLPDQTGKVSGGSHGQHPMGGGGDDGGPLGTPIRDSSSSGQGSAVFDSADIFNTNSNENPFTDAVDLIAEAAATAATPTSDSSSTNFFPDANDFNPDLLTSGHGFPQNYFDDSSPSADGDMDLVKSFGGGSQQNTPSGTPQNPTPHGQSTPEPSLKDPFDMGIVFGGSSGGGKPLLGQAPDLGDTHGGGSQSPLMMSLGATCSDFKSAEPKVKQQQQALMRPKDENGGSGSSSSMIGMGSSSAESKQVKRSRTPSSEGKSKDKPPKRKKMDPEGKSPSHSSGGRPYTPPSGGSGSGGSISGGGSKSPGSSGRSQTPPGGATPPIPKITIQIPKGTITGGKTSSHSGYTSSSSATSSTGGSGGTSSSKSHHSHSSSSGKIKSKDGSMTQSSSSKPGSGGVGGGGGQSQSKGSSQGMGVGKPGSSPITKHGLSGPGGSGGGIGSSNKIKPQSGKPPGSLMNPSIKPNISPSHSRSSSSGDKMSSPMKMQQSQVPGTPPSSKAKSPMGSGGSSSGGSKSSSGGGMSSQKPMGGSSSSSSASSSSSSSSSSSGSVTFSGGSQSQYGGGSGGSGGGGGTGGGSGGGRGGGGGGGSGSNSGSGGGGGQNNANNPNAKGKSPSRNKKPSLTAVIDKLKSVGGGGVGEDGCEVGPPGGGPGSGSTPGGGSGNVPSSGSSNMGSSKHSTSSQSGEYKREKSDKEAKAKVSVSGGNSGDKKLMDPKTGGVGATGLAKIIISKPDGGSPSIKAKVTLQKTGEGSGDSMRPQISSLKASPLFSGSTPKHDRSSPSHSRSPGYTPLNHDSESESGSSSVAEKSHQNSPSSDDDQTMRPLPPQDYMSSIPLSSGEKHKKHKKEKKKQKERERERERDRDRDRDREKEKKKSSMSMGPSSHPIKADSWSRSPISASDTSLSMLGQSRSSPMYMGNEDDDLMDSALTGNL